MGRGVGASSANGSIGSDPELIAASRAASSVVEADVDGVVEAEGAGRAVGGGGGGATGGPGRCS